MKEKEKSGSVVPIVIFAAIAVLILSFTLTKRLTYLREEAQYRAFSESLSRYALAYVYRKYGIEPETVSESEINRDRYDRGFDAPGYICADYTMKDQREREFTVYVRADLLDSGIFKLPQSLTCTDDYQQPDIEEAVREKIKSAFNESIYLRMSLDGDLPLDLLYNGNNLDCILQNITGVIEACIPDNADLNALNTPAVTELLESLKGNDDLYYIFTFWNSPEILEEFADHTNSQKFRSTSQNTWYELYAPYITSFITDETDKPQTLCLNDGENCAYCCFPANSSLSFAEGYARLDSRNEEICEYDSDTFGKYVKDKAWLSKPLGKCYYLKSGSESGDICVYIPLKNFEEMGVDAENTAAVTVYTGGITNTKIVKPSICGEYAVYVMTDRSAFMLVDVTGLE
ncbi:MAG: hypothetical protein NC078_00410 [Ruminococcus sp.]|nr:hypothetical protein [Ruminococcus sp.]